MNNLLKLAALTLTLGLSATAYAGEGHRHNPTHNHGNPNVAPEVDPSLAIAGLGLLGGTLTVLRSRRRK